jgi:hypothetical protein
MMRAPLEDAPLRRAHGHEPAKLVPPEPGVRPEACEMDRIGCYIVPGEQLFRPLTRIIIEANETVRPGPHALMMQKREVLEAELPGNLLEEKMQILRAGTAAGLLSELIGKARPGASLRHVRPRARNRICLPQSAPHRALRWHSTEQLSSGISGLPCYASSWREVHGLEFIFPLFGGYSRRGPLALSLLGQSLDRRPRRLRPGATARRRAALGVGGLERAPSKVVRFAAAGDVRQD